MAVFSISLAGLKGSIQRLDVSSNNLANLITPGFKSSRVDQVELSGAGQVSVDFSQGPLEFTGDKFSLAVQGNGLFQVDTSQGTRYTGAGQFRLDSNGFVVTPDGHRLVPNIQIPSDASEVSISADGTISAKVGNNTTQLGRIELARFTNPQGLVQEGSNLFAAGANSGNPIHGNPGADSFGSIAFGVLEQSNVDLSSEMVSMIVSKALAKVNIAAIKTKDETLGEIIDISK